MGGKELVEARHVESPPATRVGALSLPRGPCRQRGGGLENGPDGPGDALRRHHVPAALAPLNVPDRREGLAAAGLRPAQGARPSTSSRTSRSIAAWASSSIPAPVPFTITLNAYSRPRVVVM